jgi:hypothetical protein
VRPGLKNLPILGEIEGSQLADQRPDRLDVHPDRVWDHGDVHTQAELGCKRGPKRSRKLLRVHATRLRGVDGIAEKLTGQSAN